MGRKFDGNKVVTCPIPAHLQDTIAPIRTMILEAVAETDEALMEKYFAEEELTQDEIEAAFKKGVLSNEIVPVLCGSSVASTGISVLMDTMISLFPAPHESAKTVQADSQKSLFVFKTIVDPFIGKLSLFKVKSGMIKTDDNLYNVREGETERFAHIYVVSGKDQDEVSELYPGDIGAVAKLKTPKTGDTFGEKASEDAFEGIPYPKGLVKKAIFPAGKGDEEKLSSSLVKLMAEDGTLSVDNDKETHETVLCGIGEQQLDVVVSMLKNKYKVEAFLKEPTTPYRETIKGKVSVRGKHKKQSGGHGQYGDVVMEFEPSGDLELPFVFEEKVFGGSVPKQYFPAVEKGLDECTSKGVLAGYPVVGVKAILLDGSYHPVDSSGMAFKMATTLAFKEGVGKAKPTLLEPIAHVEISVPNDYTGDIMGDMKKRRGRMIGMEQHGRNQVIIAEVPLAELYTYATDVRSMTQGRGEVDYYFVRYEEAPVEVQQKVIAARA